MTEIKKIVKKKGGERVVILVDEKVREEKVDVTLRDDEVRLDWRKLKPGDEVRVLSTGEKARIVKLPDMKGVVEVQPEKGGERKRLYMRDLCKVTFHTKKGPLSEKVERDEEGEQPPLRESGVEARAPSIDLQALTLEKDLIIDLRGLRADEALFEMEKGMKEFLGVGRSYAFILHGTGSGVLKEAVRKNLKRIKEVEEWKPGSRRQGGDGVTVVRFRS